MNHDTEAGPVPDAPVIVAVDGSEIALQATAWAAAEAVLCGSPLLILTAGAVPGFGDPLTAARPEELARLRAEGARILADAARIAGHVARTGSLTLTTEFALGPITGTLIDRSAAARMIVLGHRGRGAVRCALLGSVSAVVVRHAHCPVAIVHGISETDPVAAAQPVVVGVDGSAGSLPALRMAFEEAGRRSARLIVVRAWGDTTGFELPARGWESIRRAEEELLDKQIAEVAADFPAVPTARIVACDNPVRALLEYAERAQLLVVGSHGRGGFAAMTLGSVSTAVLHYATCPVLVVRADMR